MRCYKREEEIGSGTYGKVYRVRMTGSGERLAIKVNLCNPNTSFIYSLKEMDMNASLSHPCICSATTMILGKPFDDASSVDILESSKNKHLRIDDVHFVSPLASCDLYTLYLSDRMKSIKLPQLDKMMYEMLCALEYIHYKGIVHRDVKINNFLVFEERGELTCKMTDFGLSKRYIPNQPRSPPVMLHYFRSPEWVYGDGEDGFKSDVWGMGCIFYELLTNRLPFVLKRSSDSELIECVRSNLYDHDAGPTERRKVNNVCDFLSLDKGMRSQLGSSRERFLYYLIGSMFRYKPEKRYSASECLNCDYFIPYKGKIESIRSRAVWEEKQVRYPVLRSERITQSVGHAIELYNNRDKLKWYSPVALISSVVMFEEIIDSQERAGETMKKEDTILYFLSVVYMYIKYYMNSKNCSRMVMFSCTDPDFTLTDELINKARLFERYVIKQSSFIINRRTLFEELCSRRKPTEEDVYRLLTFYRSGRHQGLTVEEAYNVWVEGNY